MSLWNGFAKAYPISASDVADIGQACDALIVTTAGNLVITPVQGSTVTFAAVPCGTFIPIKTKRVLSSGTTAVVAGLHGN